MPRSPASLGALLLVSVLSVGCGGDDITEPATVTSSPSTPAGAETVSPSSNLDDVIAEARQLVATEAGVSEDAVEVIEADEVTWPSGALGCPEPDKSYTQALVDGYRIVLEADGEEFHVHGSTGEAPFLCQDPEEPTQS